MSTTSSSDLLEITVPSPETDHIWSLLVRAREHYRAATSPNYDEVLWEISQRAEVSGSLGKVDIGALLVWKRLSARTRWAAALMALPDTQVRAVTGKAWAAVRDASVPRGLAAQAGRAALVSLPGFHKGDALASAVLTAAAPLRMAVYDSRAQRALGSLGIVLTAESGRYGRYMGIIDEILARRQPSEQEWTARDVDVALFSMGGS
ncbi:hypothetical protein ACFCZ6_36410 [Streptomyces hydrogenans]|uniref:hypothetical protein n=1 Tax=Streptomyces hydrogenans TaxID=1873719 RepID=UPI0035D7C015